MHRCPPNQGGFGSYRVINDYTFNATVVGSKPLFTVTGDVIVRLIAICTTTVVTVGTAGTCSVGIAGNVAYMIPVTSGDALVAREIWHDTSPDSEIELLSSMGEFTLSDGNDIALDLLSATFTSGAIRFICIWTALGNDSRVVRA